MTSALHDERYVSSGEIERVTYGYRPSGKHLEQAALATGRERVRRAAIGLELLARQAPELVISPKPAKGLGVPVRL